jgi:hypothetical protein
MWWGCRNAVFTGYGGAVGMLSLRESGGTVGMLSLRGSGGALMTGLSVSILLF